MINICIYVQYLYIIFNKCEKSKNHIKDTALQTFSSFQWPSLYTKKDILIGFRKQNPFLGSLGPYVTSQQYEYIIFMFIYIYIHICI